MQTITQTFNADGSSITISINVHLPFALARAAAGAPCCGCRCPRAHSGGGDVGGVGGSAPSGYDSQGTSTDSQLTVAGSVSAELGISEGVVGRDGAGDLETTADLEQIDSQETHVVSDSGQYLSDADLSTRSPSQSLVLLRSTGKTMNETSSPSQSPVLLLHAGREAARSGVVSDVVSKPRGISLVGSGAASEDSTGGGKPAVVATATQSPTSSGHVAAEDCNGGGKPAVVATAAQSPTSSMAPGGSPGGMETSSPPTVLPTSTALARAIADMNILALVQNSSYLTGLNAQLLAGVPGNARDALDMAGKLPLALKANAIGIPPHELNIDPAQAGGLLGKFDATISGSGGGPGAAGVGGVEIKGARSRRGHKKTFQLSRLRPGTRFEHLLLVVRSGNPTDWTDLIQLDDLFWLGHVSRAAFDRAVADRFGRSAPDEVKANVTIDSRRKSWLGPHIQWVQFKNLTRSWWNTNVRGVL